jgi:hypothetical protein
MSKTRGVLLRGGDGRKYFIPQSVLNEHAVAHESVKQDDITLNAPHVEAWATERLDDEPGQPHAAMLAE